MNGDEGKRDLLEKMLLDANAEPTDLPLSLLKSITNSFSEDQIIGTGGFAVVYKGFLENGLVAVKMLSQAADIDEKSFNKEVSSLIRVKHINVVRFLGYCADTQKQIADYNGNMVMADVQQRLLCFEFLPNGSLDNYINDDIKHVQLEWTTCYLIIRGICKSLNYLHQQNIVHLDLKPANILLDCNMEPKITDFGLSRWFDKGQTHHTTQDRSGTRGYMSPEFIDSGKITFKSDIYSLGIIITEILTGQKWPLQIENALECWRTRFATSSQEGTWLEHARVCAEIGLQCMRSNPLERPTTQDIIAGIDNLEHIYGSIETGVLATEVVSSYGLTQLEKLYSTATVQQMDMSATPSPLQRIICMPKGGQEESTEIRSLGSTEVSGLLDVYPLEISFPPSEPDQHTICPVSLTNRTDDFVGVWMRQTTEGRLMPVRISSFSDLDPVDTDGEYEGDTFRNKVGDYLGSNGWSYPLIILKPHSTAVVAAELLDDPSQQAPHDRATFEMLMVVMGSSDALINLNSSIGEMGSEDLINKFWWLVHELGGEVHRATLTATDDTRSSQTVKTRQFVPSTSEFGDVGCIDVHPTETWILVAHYSFSRSEDGEHLTFPEGYVSIWDYETQEKVTALQVIKQPDVLNEACHARAAKFLAPEKWFATGDDNGWVHVYDYTTKDKVKEFEAYDNGGSVVLAVHSTQPFLLTASYNHTLIKRWDWSKGWALTKTYDVRSDYIERVMFNPRDRDTFASFSIEEGITKIWHIDSGNPLTAVPMRRKVEYLSTENHRHFLVTCGNNDHDDCVYIWDPHTRKPVHTLEVKGEGMLDIACHPTLPIFVTLLDDRSSLCWWNANTYRLEKMVLPDFRIAAHMLHGPNMLFTGPVEFTRLVVGSEPKIMTIVWPTLKTDCGNEKHLSKKMKAADLVGERQAKHEDR